MAVLSTFYGMLIRLYLLDHKHHNPPHIHARHPEFEVAIRTGDGAVLSGELSRKRLHLVQAGIALRCGALMAEPTPANCRCRSA